MMRAVALVSAYVLLTSTLPQFKARVEVVRIDALVTQGNKPLAGLTAADFEVRDNGQLQQVRLADAGLSHLDVILALDMSASLTAERFAQLRAASESLLHRLRPEDRAALLTFDQRVTVRQGLTGEVERIRDSLRQATRTGRTSLTDALFSGLTMAEGGDRRTLLIVFSDGVDTSSWLESDSVVDIVRRSPVVIYGVTPTTAKTASVLSDAVDASGGEILDGRSSRLDTAFTEVLNAFRQRYLLTFSPTQTASPGWHRLDVRVKRRGATVRARRGYFVAPQSGSGS